MPTRNAVWRSWLRRFGRTVDRVGVNGVGVVGGLVCRCVWPVGADNDSSEPVCCRPVPALATRDADDDCLVALAREHEAVWIVTGDDDLLDWEEQKPRTIAPAAFEQWLIERP